MSRRSLFEGVTATLAASAAVVAANPAPAAAKPERIKGGVSGTKLYCILTMSGRNLAS